MFRVRTAILVLALAALIVSADAVAGSGVNSEAYKRAYKEMIDAGKSGYQAQIYAEGYVQAKEAGLTDARAKKFADSYYRAYNSAREQGRKCPHDCEAYASDFANQVIRAK
jgi:hypothetical protein